MKARFKISALAAVLAFALVGCTNNASSEGGVNFDDMIKDVKADEAAVALLPADIKSSGELTIGTDAEYPPNEYKDADGKPTGWSVTLAEAVAKRLGLEPKWEILGFDGIIPRIQAETLNMGSSSFTDNLERQASVDFVDFLNAGTQWAQAKGEKVDPDNACGLTVAVQTATIQEDELNAKSDACVAAGKKAIEVLKFDGQPEATNAVVSGKADAFSADLPVTGDAVAKLSDKIEVAGDVFDAAPYGFVTAKGSDMTKAVQAALQSLIDDGTYGKILEGAGIESGALKEATINGGTE